MSRYNSNIHLFTNEDEERREMIRRRIFTPLYALSWNNDFGTNLLSNYNRVISADEVALLRSEIFTQLEAEPLVDPTFVEVDYYDQDINVNIDGEVITRG